MMNVLLASTSTLHGGEYLGYLGEELPLLFGSAKEIVFVPFARPGGISHDEYTAKAAAHFATLGIALRGLHSYADPKEALAKADGIFTGGGNTFLLLHSLYRLGILEDLREAIKKGTPYLGTSAGSVIAGPSICTTNDMPIIHPPKLESLGIVPFCINAHYLDPDPNSTHNGETRETRLKEFQTLNAETVVGLREGSWARLVGDKVTLEGAHSSRIFVQGKEPYELAAGEVVGGL